MKLRRITDARESAVVQYSNTSGGSAGISGGSAGIVHAVYSSVLIWLDSFPPSASAFITGRLMRFSSFPSVASEAVSGPYRTPCRALPAHTLSQQGLFYAIQVIMERRRNGGGKGEGEGGV